MESLLFYLSNIVSAIAIFVTFTQEYVQLFGNTKSPLFFIPTGFQNVAEDNNFVQAERALRQSLHQLQHLGNVWKDVLPTSIYNKAIGKAQITFKIKP